MKTEQYRSSISREAITALGVLFVLTVPLRAQYNADFQTNIISGVTSNWSGEYVVGKTNVADALVIQTSGQLISDSGFLGYFSSSGSNNSALVTGIGSVWSNRYVLYVGVDDFGDSLLITNAAKVFNTSGFVGLGNNASSNNSVVVASGSLWLNTQSLAIGFNSSSNSLMISSGGMVINGSIGYIGQNPDASNNSVQVIDSGSVWSNRTDLHVGRSGAGNSLVISNGGKVYVGWPIYGDSGSAYVGYDSVSSNNSVKVTGPGSAWMIDGDLNLGNNGGKGNSVLISDGAEVNSAYGRVSSYDYRSSNNTVQVTGPGSVWNCTYDLYLGQNAGGGNSLVISNGAAVYTGWMHGTGYVIGPSIPSVNSSNNSVKVSGAGSIWLINGDLEVGYGGRNSSVLIGDGGEVDNEYGYLGANSNSSSNNSVQVIGPGSVWVNERDLFVGYYGAGNNLVISNGGQVFTGSSYYYADSYVGYNSSSNNSVQVIGPGAEWISQRNLYVGNSSSGNSLIISNGGKVFSDSGSIGAVGPSSSNTVLISGPGSVWSNRNVLYVGNSGTGNSLTINNGGRVFNDYGYVGGGTGSSNSVLISGPGSVWSNRSQLFIGQSGSCNSLVISNAGRVLDDFAMVGTLSNCSNNSVRVLSGANWQSRELRIGNAGRSNSLLVAGGSVFATTLVVGSSGSPVCDSTLQLDSGSVIVTNASHSGVLEVRYGRLILNGGVLQVDTLIMNVGCGRFIRNGGTLLYNQLVLDPNSDADGDGIPNGWEQMYGLDPLNYSDASADPDGDGFTNLQEFQAGTDPLDVNSSLFRITAITLEGTDVRIAWMAGTGKTNALQAADGYNGYDTNAFADIFIVTNAVGGVTNYLDVGGATNFPSRYYRVRLIP